VLCGTAAGASGVVSSVAASVSSRAASAGAPTPLPNAGASAGSFSVSVDDGETVAGVEDATEGVVVLVPSSAVSSPAADASPVGAPDVSPVG
jgi:hypothetical protein